MLSAIEAANPIRSASKQNASDCVLKMDRPKKEKPQKNTDLLHSPSATMNHRGMLFICVCVCVWEIRMVGKCPRRFPGLPQLTHHSDDDREWDTGRSSCSDEFHT